MNIWMKVTFSAVDSRIPSLNVDSETFSIEEKLAVVFVGYKYKG